MLNQQKHFWPGFVSHSVMSLDSLTVCLAYFHHYTPSALPGRRLSPLHLRQLALWIRYPTPHLRSLRTHPALAAHLAVLGCAKLLQLCDNLFTPSPSATTWLHLEPSKQLNSLLTALKSVSQWEQTISHFGLQRILPLDYTRFIQQTLERQLEAVGKVQAESSPGIAEKSPKIGEYLSWAEEDSGHEVWSLWLPLTLPSWLLFDLLQLGTWQPGKPLCCTPVSLATAVQRGYSSHHIQWLLETGFQFWIL